MAQKEEKIQKIENTSPEFAAKLLNVPIPKIIETVVNARASKKPIIVGFRRGCYDIPNFLCGKDIDSDKKEESKG